MKLLLSKIVAGFVIGAGAIIPGLSGGILAVSLGLYQSTIEAITGFFKAPKKNFKFLFPLGVGGVIGFVLFLFLIDRTFAKHQTAVVSLFLGLVVGSIPTFFSEANNGEKFKKTNLIFTALGFAFAFSLVLLGLLTGDTQSGSKELTWFTAMLAGGIIMMGVVLPGVSTSFILINMNIYDNFLDVFAHFPDNPAQNLKFALCALLGILIVAVPMLLLVRKLLLKYHCQSFYFLFGILLATLVGCIINEVIRNSSGVSVWSILLFAALFAVGVAISYIMERAMKKLKMAEAEKEKEQALS
ncbi:MAG: DUF368 domain-containing protein [Clostridia bacterium]|nr:DUF368 domain-containing protein [Clostridia bacterium]